MKPGFRIIVGEQRLNQQFQVRTTSSTSPLSIWAAAALLFEGDADEA